MLRIKCLFLLLFLSHQAYAGIRVFDRCQHYLSRMNPRTVSSVQHTYSNENRVLLFIGKHINSDRVAIWGQTALTNGIVRVLLESPRDVGKMELLLRSPDYPWAENYQNYSLHDFFVK